MYTHGIHATTNIYVHFTKNNKKNLPLLSCVPSHLSNFKLVERRQGAAFAYCVYGRTSHLCFRHIDGVRDHSDGL
jgi:predicted phosphoadenosine phosphosulfate sulfurtransferase